ncbi:MAG: hypothetical protein AAB658_02870 [Chloroflexota bacterium]
MKTLKALTTLVAVLGLLLAANGIALAAPGGGCATIQQGGLVDSMGNPLVIGYDQFGYNYQAHMFNGTYDSSDRVLDGTYWGDTGDYVDDHLMMKWSDDWLSNKDCNGDGKLDRGGLTGISQGWLTNHNEGDYIDGDGNPQHYTYFVKIVWVGPGGSLWGQYEVIQEIYNDPSAGFHGLQYKAGAPGLGLNDHWTP